jgi:hypothetical protein
MLILIGLYIRQFHGGLSESQTDWGTFGDYLSGVFAVFNLGVVIVLALYVQGMESRRRNEDAKFQANRLDREIDHREKLIHLELKGHHERLEKQLEYEKKMILMKLRLDYLVSLEMKIEDIYFSYDTDLMHKKLQGLLVKLVSFRNVIDEDMFEKIQDENKALLEFIRNTYKDKDVKTTSALSVTLSTISSDFINKARSCIVERLTI